MHIRLSTLKTDWKIIKETMERVPVPGGHGVAGEPMGERGRSVGAAARGTCWAPWGCSAARATRTRSTTWRGCRFSAALAALFVAGLALAVWRGRRPAYGLWVAWLGIMLVAGGVVGEQSALRAAGGDHAGGVRVPGAGAVGGVALGVGGT